MPLLAVVHQPANSGIPADEVQNTFAFDLTPGVADVNLFGITAAISDFFNGVSGGLAPLTSFLSPSIGNETEPPFVRFYDLTGHLSGASALGAPVGELAFDYTVSPAGTALPSEVACCLSFHADYGADVEFGAGGTRPRSRDRGRVFIGPLDQSAVGAGANGTARVHSNLQHTLYFAGQRLQAAEVNWCVWSRSKAALLPVTAMYVDDAFDVQRRRGEAPTSRYTGA